MSVSIFFAFVFFVFPKISSADVLLPGSINTCGELAVPGVYTLTTNVGNGTSTCFTISSDNVIINGGGYTISGSGSVAIDARPRTGGPSGPLTEGANGYTNLIVNELNITGYTTGINLSGNDDSSGTGVTNGAGGNGGDVAIYYSTVGSITSGGGNSTTRSYGGIGGNILLSSFDLNIASSTLSVLGGTGTAGRNTDGGLDLNYTNSLIKTSLTLSSLYFLNDNTTNYGVYIGGTWPLFPGDISTCGTLFGSGTYTLTQSITGVTDTCFKIGSNDIVLNGAGYTVTSATTTNTSYFANASTFSNFTLASTTATNFSNFVTSSSTVTVSGTILNLSNKRITSPNVTIDAGALTLTSAIFSTLVLNINYSVSIAGTSTATIATNITSFKINNLEYGPRLTSDALFGDVWLARDNTRSWYGITSSADGAKLAAAVYNGYIYTSQDSGATWATSTGSGIHYWKDVTSDASGTKLAAVETNGYVYTSTNGGITWTQQISSGSRSWNSIASSADGTKLIAGVAGGYLYTSVDSGVTWNQRTFDVARSWYDVASDASGTKLVAVDYSYGYIYTSTTSGATWTTNGNSSGSRTWYGITSSADGTKLAAVDYSYGYIYTSTTSGATWTTNGNSSGSRTWNSITSSADGTKLAAVVSGGHIYSSSNSGTTWAQRTSGDTKSWYTIASSADGNKLFAGTLSSYIYINSNLDPALSVDIMVPQASSSISTWNPIVSWGISRNCYYSYDNFASTSTADCSLSGSDIISPTTTGSTTLYVKGINNSDELITKSVSFTNNSNQNIQVNLPALNTTYDAMSWVPNVNYSTTDADIVTCQYSYNNWVSSSTVDCALGGSDISPPPDGYATLYIRTVDSENNVNISSSVFYYESSLYTYTSSGLRYWNSLTVSNDGSKMIAIVGQDSGTNYYGQIYTSSNSGTTWTAREIVTYWNSLVSSFDAVKLAVISSSWIYTSVDGGVNWVKKHLLEVVIGTL